MARLAITSLTFMFVEVPAPPCSASTGNCSAREPPAISSHAWMIAAATLFARPPRRSPIITTRGPIFSFCCERQDDFDLAIAARRRAIELKSDWAEHWHRLGVCLAKRGELTEAIVALRKSREMDPAAEGIAHDLIMVLCKDNQHQAAKEVALPPPPAKPVGDITMKFLSASLKSAGRFEEATELWRRTLEIDPSRPDTHGEWAMCLITLGDCERGWREYEAGWGCETFKANRRLDPRRHWGG